jgi:hypothetical protein
MIQNRSEMEFQERQHGYKTGLKWSFRLSEAQLEIGLNNFVVHYRSYLSYLSCVFYLPNTGNG